MNKPQNLITEIQGKLTKIGCDERKPLKSTQNHRKASKNWNETIINQLLLILSDKVFFLLVFGRFSQKVKIWKKKNLSVKYYYYLIYSLQFYFKILRQV